jgi:hypothetical protein
MNQIYSVILLSFYATVKIFIISAVGMALAFYPKGDPILPTSALRYLARLTNLVLLPCLVLYSLGSTVTIPLLRQIGIVIPFGMVIDSISYLLAYTLGKLLHEKDAKL